MSDVVVFTSPDEDPGAGIETSLVADGGLLATLRLVDSVTTTTGVLAATYQPTRTNSGPEYPGPNENRTVADHSALLPQPRRRSGGRVTANDCMVLAALVQAEAVAIAAASTRPATPSLARMLETCTLAVLGLMNNAWAIWRLLRPAATSASTSASRGVRPSCSAGVDAPVATAGAPGPVPRYPGGGRRDGR